MPGPLPAPDPLPVVTVQLPIYNEMYVVDRLLEAVCAHRLPAATCSRSRCSTTRPTRRARSPSWPCARHAEQGFDIQYIHRVDRTGFKAGALEPGLQGRHGRVRRHLRRRLRAPADFLQQHRAALRRPEGRHGAGALGPHQPRLLAAHPRPGDPARRPLRPRARRPQPLRPLLQLQRHRGHLAARRPSTTPAAGSTTR